MAHDTNPLRRSPAQIGQNQPRLSEADIHERLNKLNGYESQHNTGRYWLFVGEIGKRELRCVEPGGMLTNGIDHHQELGHLRKLSKAA